MFHNPFILVGTFALVVLVLSFLSTFGAAWLADTLWERTPEAKRAAWWRNHYAEIRAFDPSI